MKKYLQEERGFTLIEVLASIVIISIIFIGVVQLLTFTNKTAVSNNSKLVATYLAKATIERVEIEPEKYFDMKDVHVEPNTYRFQDCTTEACEELYQLHINDQHYEVIVKTSQNSDEENLQLINVVVTVEQKDKNIASTVEGYVAYELSE